MNTQSKHLIFGSGLTGSFLAGVLKVSGQDVKCLARSPFRELLQSGFRIQSLNSQASAELSVSCDVSAAKAYDYIWITTKATVLDSNIEQIRQLISANTKLIFCQNGVGIIESMSPHFPNTECLRAIFEFNVVLNDDNVFTRVAGDGLSIQQSGFSLSQQQLENPYCEVNVSDDMQAIEWAKLQLNLSNPVNALSDIPLKQVLEDHGFRQIIADLQDELLTVTQAMGLKLPKLTAVAANWLPRVLRLPNFLYLRLAKSVVDIDPKARMSMSWDLRNGKQTEISVLNQAVVDAANKLNKQAPLNLAISALVREVENGQRQYGMSAKELRQLMMDKVSTNA